MDERTPPQAGKGLPEAELAPQNAREAVRRMLARSPRRPFAQHRRHGSHHGYPADEDAGRYDEAFRNVERRLTAAQEQARRERLQATAQWSSLENHPPGRRLVMVLNDERLHHWGLYELLAEKSRTLAADEPTAAVNLAVLALAVADRLDPQVYGATRVTDFKTYALVLLGDARRLASDLAGARLAFSQARINVEMGSGDLLEEAHLLGALVSLLCDCGEYEKAAESLERANALYRRLGDSRHLEGVSVQPEAEPHRDRERQDTRIG